MENFSPCDDLSASPVHSSSSPDFTVISLPLAVAPMPPRTKKGRRGKYDPERDYSAEIRRRLQQSPRGKRTARACDRCKCRKLPCDENEESCNNCVRHGTVCYMTDTSTGQTYPRNIIMQKTTEIFNLRDQLRDLQYQLREKDCQIRDLKQSIQNLNLLHHHQSPGVHLENLSEFHSQDGGVMHPDQGIAPQQLELQTRNPYLSEQYLNTLERSHAGKHGL